MIEIILAGEPVGKGRPRFSRKSGAVYTPEKTARFEERLAWAAQQAMRGHKLFEGALRVRMDAYVSIPKSMKKTIRQGALMGLVRPTKKPDADNFAKMLDACNKVVWVDDSQIVSLQVEKHYSTEPRMVIKISD